MPCEIIKEAPVHQRVTSKEQLRGYCRAQFGERRWPIFRLLLDLMKRAAVLLPKVAEGPLREHGGDRGRVDVLACSRQRLDSAVRHPQLDAYARPLQEIADQK